MIKYRQGHNNGEGYEIVGDTAFLWNVDNSYYRKQFPPFKLTVDGGDVSIVTASRIWIRLK